MEGAVCLLGFGQREVLIDAEDLPHVAPYHWWLFCARKTSGGEYVYVIRKRAKKALLLHREVMRAPLGLVVDHLNGNRLDNRRANLRICTQKENMQNVKRAVSNTSGYKGVSQTSDKRGWVAKCAKRYLGTFTSKEDAAAAYAAEACRRFSHLARGEA